MVLIFWVTFTLRCVSLPTGPDFQLHGLHSQSQLFCNSFFSLQSSAQISEVLSSSENLATVTWWGWKSFESVGVELCCESLPVVTRCALILWFTVQWHKSEALNIVE